MAVQTPSTTADPTSPFWRPLTPADLPALMAIANTIHPELPEHESVFLERMKLFPSGCLALVVPGTERFLGYTISHPIISRQPPALDALLGSIEEGAGQYYIHDVALLPEARGTGMARVGVESLLDVAREGGFKTMGLVSVYGTAEFWGRFGFEAVEDGSASGSQTVALDGLREKVRAYGDDAVWLERKI